MRIKLAGLRHWLGTVILLAGVSGGTYGLVIEDFERTRARALLQQQELLSELKAKAQKAAQLDAYREQALQIESDYRDALSRLPITLEPEAVHEQIRAIVDATNGRIVEFSVGDKIFREADSYRNFRVVVRLSYRSLIELLAQLRLSQRAIRISAMEINASENGVVTALDLHYLYSESREN